MRPENFLDSPDRMETPQPAPSWTQQHQQQQHSTWRSPVPYLFGGLAAMMGLIAFALLLLACSYWRLSGYLEQGGPDDLESAGGGGKPDDAAESRVPLPPPEQRIVVIMAGNEKPTFLATPTTSRASSFGDNAGNSGTATVEGDMTDVKGKIEESAAGRGGGNVPGRQQEGTLPESRGDHTHQSP